MVVRLHYSSTAIQLHRLSCACYVWVGQDGLCGQDRMVCVGRTVRMGVSVVHQSLSTVKAYTFPLYCVFGRK